MRIESILYRTAQMPNPEWLPRHSLPEVQCFLEPLRPQSLSYPAPWSSNSNSSQHSTAPQAHISNVRRFLKGQQEALPHPSMHPSFPYCVFSKEGKLQKRRSGYIKGHPSTALLPTPFSCCWHGLNTSVGSISAVDDTTSCQWFRMKDYIKQWPGAIFPSN